MKRTAALTLAAVFAASGCSTSATTSPATTAAATTAPTVAARTAEDACTDAAGTTVDYYGSGDPPDQKEINAFFIAKYPNIKVNFINKRTNESVTKLITESQAGRAPEVDIVTGNMADQLPLLKFGLAASLPLKELGLSESKIRVVAGLEVVRLKRKFGGLVYNTQLTKPEDLPDTWEGLIDPALKGKFMSDPRGVYLAVLRFPMGQEKYEKYITDLVAAIEPVAVQNTTPQIQKVLTGEFLTGDAGQDSDIYQQAATGAPVDIKFLDVVTTFDIYGTF